ncbi:28900_t:CDS:1, partial [Racocetra persica]
CEQDIDKGYRKFVEAANFYLSDTKSWKNKYGGIKDYNAEVAKNLLYKDEYNKVIQNLNNQYDKKPNKSEYVRLGLARYCIRRKYLIKLWIY